MINPIDVIAAGERMRIAQRFAAMRPTPANCERQRLAEVEFDLATAKFRLGTAAAEKHFQDHKRVTP